MAKAFYGFPKHPRGQNTGTSGPVNGRTHVVIDGGSRCRAVRDRACRVAEREVKIRLRIFERQGRHSVDGIVAVVIS